MMAMAGMNDAMGSLLKNLNLEGAQREMSYNPEFFPTLKPIELTEEQKAVEEETMETVAALRHQMHGSGKAFVPITNLFDPIGDFVEARYTVESNEMLVEGKVAVNPQYYMLEKHRELENTIGMDAPVKAGKTGITVH